MCYEVLGTVMNWLCRVHLSQPLPPTELAAVQQASSKILPSIAALMPCITSLSTMAHLQLPLLQYTYWCMAHLTSKKHKSALTSSLRRIGEAVYKPRVSWDLECTFRVYWTLICRFQVQMKEVKDRKLWVPSSLTVTSTLALSHVYLFSIHWHKV